VFIVDIFRLVNWVFVIGASCECIFLYTC